MCGRFAQVITHQQLQKLERELHLKEVSQQIEANFNVAPTQTVAAILSQDAGAYIGYFRWGLIPSWARELPSNALINARVETIHQKPSFRGGLQRRRCLIPVTGFYEWRKSDKQPFFFRADGEDPLLLGAIYDAWYGDDGSYVPSTAIITKEADATLESYHHRMPLIFGWEDAKAWLNHAQQEVPIMQELISRLSAPTLNIYPVSKKINYALAAGSDLIEPITL